MTGQKDNVVSQQSADRQSPHFHVLMGSQQYLVVKHAHRKHEDDEWQVWWEARLAAMDTMNFWIKGTPDELKETL